MRIRMNWRRWVILGIVAWMAVVSGCAIMGWEKQLQETLTVLDTGILAAVACTSIWVMCQVASALDRVTEAARLTKDGKITFTFNMKFKDDHDEPWRESLGPDPEGDE